MALQFALHSQSGQVPRILASRKAVALSLLREAQEVCEIYPKRQRFLAGSQSAHLRLRIDRTVRHFGSKGFNFSRIKDTNCPRLSWLICGSEPPLLDKPLNGSDADLEPSRRFLGCHRLVPFPDPPHCCHSEPDMRGASWRSSTRLLCVRHLRPRANPIHLFTADCLEERKPESLQATDANWIRL